MRFACQSCGKAYNLPEEKIAEKSNVKLKCRVCGSIVEVKKQGEIVAQVLADGEARRGGRVSEAPAPLTSITPEEAEEATQAISIADGSLAPLPPSPATGFSASAFSASLSASSLSGATPVPPPLGSEPPARLEPSAAGGAFASAATTSASPALSAPVPPPPAVPLPPPPVRASAPSAPLPPPPVVPAREPMELPVLNGNHSPMTNGGSGGFRLPDLEAKAPAASSAAQLTPEAPAVDMAPVALPAPAAAEGAPAQTEGLHNNSMLVASFLTGVLVGVIIAFLFFQ